MEGGEMLPPPVQPGRTDGMREHVGIQHVFPEFFTEYLRSNNEAVGWVARHGLGFPPEAIYTAFADLEPERCGV